MIRLEPIAPPTGELLRSWNLFFSDGDRPGPMRYVLRRGFRHVEAAAYFADEDRWVFVIPSRRQLLVLVKCDDEATPYYSAMVERASVVLRIRGRAGRFEMPALCGCVGVVKALVGIRSRALTPYGLFRHLLREGAEILYDQRFLQTGSAASAGHQHCADAEAGSGTGGRGTAQAATGPASG